jgi:hypothetical protein
MSNNGKIEWTDASWNVITGTGEVRLNEERLTQPLTWNGRWRQDCGARNFAARPELHLLPGTERRSLSPPQSRQDRLSHRGRRGLVGWNAEREVLNDD